MTIYPTFLYIKQHSVTGLKYFGKTIKDPYKYKGSGKHWVRHIKKHGTEHIETLWVSTPFIDSELISEYALTFSKEHNIVESKDWANLMEENGQSGGRTCRGIPKSAEHRAKIGAGRLGKTASDETKSKQSVAKIGNTNSKGKYPSSETRAKLSAAKLGKIRGPYKKSGIHFSTETKAKMSANNDGKTKYQCQHCNKLVGGKANLNRWHGDNCKLIN